MPPKREIKQEYIESDGDVIRISKTFLNLETNKVRYEYEWRFVSPGVTKIIIQDPETGNIKEFVEYMDKSGIKTRYPIPYFG